MKQIKKLPYLFLENIVEIIGLIDKKTLGEQTKDFIVKQLEDLKKTFYLNCNLFRLLVQFFEKVKMLRINI